MTENTNPNAVPMGCVIDVYLKYPRLGPSQPFTLWEARRHAIEQVRHNEVDEVIE